MPRQKQPDAPLKPADIGERTMGVRELDESIGSMADKEKTFTGLDARPGES